MGVISRLPDDLANQIAAGEVVERPASVVKELVENAVDAGATRVRIEVEGGGVARLSVTDDGSGMSREDASLAIERHATSKLRTLDDLSRLRSYGFRGEALPSIASVSRFALRTRRQGDEAGTEILIEGGSPATARPCGIAVGTTVEVRDLFFNVPARRKFLRSLATESAHVTEVAQTLALASPSLTVVLAREGRVMREWLRTSSLEERVTASFREETLAPCRGARGPIRVEAFLGRPERARAAASSLLLFVNNRPIRDRSLMRAVAQAYGSVLESGRYPLGVVYLELDPSLVDVNVHPQKAEVRFADGRGVGEALFRVLADELARSFGMPVAQRAWHRTPRSNGDFPPASSGGLPAALEPPALPWVFRSLEPEPDRRVPDLPAALPLPLREALAVRESFAGPQRLAARESLAAREGSAARESSAAREGSAAVEADLDDAAWSGGGARGAALEQTAAPQPYPLPASRPEQRPLFSRLSFVAQVRQTYLICEGADGLYVLDQHAAAERITFHRLRTAYMGRNIATQALLFPVRVEVTAADAAFVEEQQQWLNQLGLDVRAAGPTTVAVHAVPRLLVRAEPETVVRDLIAEAGRDGGRAFSDAVDLVLATMACHGSVRAGDRLSGEEAKALLAALDQVDFSGHCPHGRPIVTRLGWDELERKVGRR